MLELPLTKGAVAIVDDSDADLGQYKWCLHREGYAVRGVRRGGRRSFLLHREILARMLNRPLKRNELTDHINGNRLDNRRSNLRLVSYTESAQNVGRHKDNVLGYKGVVYHPGTGKYRACIGSNGKHYHLGLFDTPEAAYEAYKAAADKYHGNFARYE